MTGIEQFVADNVPHRSDLASAVLEHAALQRGIDVERLDQSVVLVPIQGALVPFLNLNGPDTTRMGELMCSYHDGLRMMLADRGIPVAPSSTFLTSQPKTALGYAKKVGWPVTVRPARVAGDRGLTRDVRDPDEFRAAWQRAGRAYGKQPGQKRILVERYADGDRLSFFVVDQSVVSVTHRVPVSVVGDGASGVRDLIGLRNTDLIDVTDETSVELKRLAVEVVASIPGLAYAEVTMVLPDPSGGAGQTHVIDTVDCAAAPIAHFPTHGQPRDVAGAILERYLSSPRWPIPLQLSHTAAGGDVSAVEPLFQGRK